MVAKIGKLLRASHFREQPNRGGGEKRWNSWWFWQVKRERSDVRESGEVKRGKGESHKENSIVSESIRKGFS